LVWHKAIAIAARGHLREGEVNYRGGGRPYRSGRAWGEFHHLDHCEARVVRLSTNRDD